MSTECQYLDIAYLFGHYVGILCCHYMAVLCEVLGNLNDLGFGGIILVLNGSIVWALYGNLMSKASLLFLCNFYTDLRSCIIIYLSFTFFRGLNLL